MNQHVTLLDCTLRDGSYAVDYRWTVRDTARVCAALEDAGVTMIEIGHGVGLNGSNERNGIAAATDAEYCDAAASALRSAKFGAFFIPSIGRLEDIDAAHARGLGFLRIGTNATQVDDAREAILHAKRLGLHVSYNPMKSYLLPPQAFAEAVHRVEAWGADAVYIVDSAGTMLPMDVSAYIGETRSKMALPIGFHGHNNLALAAANCLAAYQAGATMLDATLQGIGRSGGNAHLEALVGLFDRLNVNTGIDLFKALRAGEDLVRPLMSEGGITALDVAMGMGGFHSSFWPRVEAVLRRIPVDPKRLILELGKVERQNPSEQLIEEIALRLTSPAVVELVDHDVTRLGSQTA